MSTLRVQKGVQLVLSIEETDIFFIFFLEKREYNLYQTKQQKRIKISYEKDFLLIALISVYFTSVSFTFKAMYIAYPPLTIIKNNALIILL